MRSGRHRRSSEQTIALHVILGVHEHVVSVHANVYLIKKLFSNFYYHANHFTNTAPNRQIEGDNNNDTPIDLHLIDRLRLAVTTTLHLIDRLGMAVTMTLH